MKQIQKKTLISLSLYLLLAIILSYVVVINRSHHLSVGQLAPLDGTIKIFRGGHTSFRQLNDKPLLVNFWASFCPPCLKELPLINKLFNKYQNSINFIGIAVDSEVDQKISYPIGFVDKKTLEDWQVFSLPTTYLIDKHGQIIWAQIGRIDEESLKEAIEGLIFKPLSV